jgi:hypothetical protein
LLTKRVVIDEFPKPVFQIIFFKAKLIFKIIYSYEYTLFGLSLPLALPPPSPTHSVGGRTCSALFSNFVEKKT